MDPIDDYRSLSKEQLDLIEHFEANYNAVDHFLRDALGCDNAVPFIGLVGRYSDDHTGWSDAELLKTIAAVRNAIVHWKTEAYRYVAVPTPEIARRLRNCRDRLTNPVRAIPKFQRPVEVVSVSDTLTQVLKIIKERDYSQFPVFESGQFRGLLTENGITRWLAHHVATELSLIELDDVTVNQVLENEEQRTNYKFVARDMRVDDLSSLFASQELLEAVLITQNGIETEKLMGIATRWDMIHIA
jgi:predicted transcriptional regulator